MKQRYLFKVGNKIIAIGITERALSEVEVGYKLGHPKWLHEKLRLV